MKLFLLGTALLTATLTFAEERKPFIGLELGKAEGSFSYAGVDYDGENQTTLGAKVGAVGKNDRIYLSYIDVDKVEYSSINYTEKYKALLINLEAMTDPYTIVKGVAPQLFVGVHGGMAKVNATLSTWSGSDEDLLYGVQAGALVNITDNVSIEAGYRYSWSELSLAGVSVDNVKSYYAGLNFSF